MSLADLLDYERIRRDPRWSPCFATREHPLIEEPGRSTRIVTHISASAYSPIPSLLLMNVRRSRSFRNGTSLAVILPADWVRGNHLTPGDEVELAYDAIVRITPLRKSTASDSGAQAPGAPARRPVQPAESDDGGIVGGGG